MSRPRRLELSGGLYHASMGSGGNSQELVDTLASPFTRQLELFRTHTAEVTMPADSIVERLDIVGDVRPCNLPVPVDPLPDAFLLQAAKEGFCDRIVPAMPPPAHAGLQMMALAEASPVITSVLGALIRMNDGPLFRAPEPHGLEHGIEDELAIHRGPRGPAHDPAGEQIHHHRQVKSSLPRSDIGDVRNPRSIGTGNVEIARQDIGCQPRWFGRGPISSPVASARSEVVGTHESGHTMLAASLTGLAKIEEHARGAVDALACSKRSAD